jgi:hypothetical protein
MGSEKRAAEHDDAGQLHCLHVSSSRLYYPAMERIRVEQHGSVGLLWFGGWLFTLGYVHLTFWKGVLALVIWPYYLGVLFAPVAH